MTTWSAPSARTSCALASVETVPITRAPAAFAICTTRPPAPPAAAWIRQVCVSFSGNVDRVR